MAISGNTALTTTTKPYAVSSSIAAIGMLGIGYGYVAHDPTMLIVGGTFLATGFLLSRCTNDPTIPEVWDILKDKIGEIREHYLPSQ